VLWPFFPPARKFACYCADVARWCRTADAEERVPFAHGECGPVRPRDIRHCPLEPSSSLTAASCELKSVDVRPAPGDG
jgi:hypothetical protein